MTCIRLVSYAHCDSISMLSTPEECFLVNLAGREPLLSFIVGLGFDRAVR